MMLVIFDCDGVLIDSEIIYCAVDSAALARLGHQMEAPEIAKRFTGMPSIEMWKHLAVHFGFTASDALIEEILAEYSRRLESELACIPGVVQVVQKATELGHSVCVASSSDFPSLSRNLQIARIHELFHPHIFSASQVKRSKPAPDVFLYAASQMGFDPVDALVIEDSVAGVQAAIRAGMKPIGFTGGGHADPELPQRLRNAGAQQTFTSMADISNWLRAQ